MTKKKKSTGKNKLPYLTTEQEHRLKKDIPYEDIEPRVRGAVFRANEVKGIVSMQSCGGHYQGADERMGPVVSDAFVSIFCTKEIADWIYAGNLESINMKQIVTNYFDQHFDIEIRVDPVEFRELRTIFKRMKEIFGTFQAGE